MNYILDFRSEDVGGPVVRGLIVRPNEVQALLGTEDDLRFETKVTFLVHGYNVSRQPGRASLLALAEILPSVQDEALVAVLWPGDHWSWIFSYPFEGRDADDTAVQLARYIKEVIRPHAEISFVSHSLGARVVMETVNRLIGTTFSIRQICLMAAAIDDSSLASPQAYRNAVTQADRVAVLASRRDAVLSTAYPVGDLFQAFLFLEDKSDLALGFHGPKPFRGHQVPVNVYPTQIPWNNGVGHGDYFPNPPPTDKQEAAADFADQVLQGVIALAYTLNP